MSIARLLTEIGFGPGESHDLTTAQAADLMSQILDGQVSDAELNTFALAMRLKGESAPELAGFMAAVRPRTLPLATIGPVLVLPSYGSTSVGPKLTPLLALLAAQEGAQVLVHGPMTEPGHATSGDIFRDLGLPVARDMEDLVHAWRRHEPVFMATEHLCPPLARLLTQRQVVDLRPCGQTMARLLTPCSPGASLRVFNHSHAAQAVLVTQHIESEGADMALLRGTDGEPFADPRRPARLDIFLHGEARPELSCMATLAMPPEMPILPRGLDASTTARYIQGVASGEKPAPASLTRQLDCLLSALTALRQAPGTGLPI